MPYSKKEAFMTPKFRETLIIAFLFLVGFLGVLMCADESEDKPMAVHFIQSTIGITLFGGSIWIGSLLKKAGYISEPEDKSEAL